MFVSCDILQLHVTNSAFTKSVHLHCSLCNTQATSKQTLLLHADGKKHRAKARAFHAKSAPNGNATNGGLVDNKHVEDNLDASETKTANLESKKRKLDESRSDDGLVQTNGTNEIGNKPKEGDLDCHLKKAKHDGVKEDKIIESASKEDAKKEMNLKKMIKAALKTVCIFDNFISYISLCLYIKYLINHPHLDSKMTSLFRLDSLSACCHCC